MATRASLAILITLAAAGCPFETMSPEPVFSSVKVSPSSVAAPGTDAFTITISGRPNLSFYWGPFSARSQTQSPRPGTLEEGKTVLAGFPFDLNTTSTARWTPRADDGTVATGPQIITVRVSGTGGAFPNQRFLNFKFTVGADGATTFDGYEKTRSPASPSPEPSASAAATP